jgi:hypothetical protein
VYRGFEMFELEQRCSAELFELFFRVLEAQSASMCLDWSYNAVDAREEVATDAEDDATLGPGIEGDGESKDKSVRDARGAPRALNPLRY